MITFGLFIDQITQPKPLTNKHLREVSVSDDPLESIRSHCIKLALISAVSMTLSGFFYMRILA